MVLSSLATLVVHALFLFLIDQALTHRFLPPESRIDAGVGMNIDGGA